MNKNLKEKKESEFMDCFFFFWLYNLNKGNLIKKIMKLYLKINK